MCLDSVKIIRQICFSSFGKGGSTKYLKVFTEKVILLLEIILRKKKTIFLKVRT